MVVLQTETMVKNNIRKGKSAKQQQGKHFRGLKKEQKKKDESLLAQRSVEESVKKSESKPDLELPKSALKKLQTEIDEFNDSFDDGSIGTDFDLEMLNEEMNHTMRLTKEEIFKIPSGAGYEIMTPDRIQSMISKVLAEKVESFLQFFSGIRFFFR
jgi:hypothetical protein